MVEKVKAELKIPIPESFNDDLREMLRAAAREVIQETVKQEIKLKDWLSVQEVQALFDLSPNTFSAWVRGGLPVSYVGQKRYVSKKNLDEFLANHQK